MKKIVTLLLCFSATYFASAQSTREMEDVKDIIMGPKKGSGSTRTGDDKDIILGRDERRVYDNDRNRYPSRTSGSTEAGRINREYDAKIQSIRNNRHLSSAEKERAIRQLENDRNRRLRALDERYSKDRRRYDDRRYDDDDDRRYSKKNNKHYKGKKKGNNGNHYGWQKGKGNPHRNRD